MANVTLSIDDALLKKGRDYASSRGTSLNALLRNHLNDLTQTSEDEIDAMLKRMQASEGDSGGVKFTRDELYQS